MKKTLLITTLILFITSNVYSQSRVPDSSLYRNDESQLMYYIKTDKLFTGLAYNTPPYGPDEKWEMTYRKGLPNGKFRFWDKDNLEHKEMEGRFKGRDTYHYRDIPVGKWTYWYEDGQKKRTGKYKGLDENGRYMHDGKWIDWHENGQKWSESNYKDGKLDGLYTSWHENGHKRQEVIFKDGKRNGLATKWYDNGKKMAEGTFKDGELISEQCWDEAGNETEDCN